MAVARNAKKRPLEFRAYRTTDIPCICWLQLKQQNHTRLPLAPNCTFFCFFATAISFAERRSAVPALQSRVSSMCVCLVVHFVRVWPLSAFQLDTWRPHEACLTCASSRHSRLGRLSRMWWRHGRTTPDGRSPHGRFSLYETSSGSDRANSAIWPEPDLRRADWTRAPAEQ